MRGQITRRDFLEGIGGAVALGLATKQAASAPLPGGASPPARTGWLGSAPRDYEIAHRLRDGEAFPTDGLALTDRFDLIVIGAGISGLSAAYLYRKAHPEARILILDNHDDFGGTARRNEFTHQGRLLVKYAGSETMQSPHSKWSPQARALIAELGIDLGRFETAFDRNLYPDLKLSRATFFHKEAFGEDRLVTGDPLRITADDVARDRMNSRSVRDFVADFPLESEQKERLVALITEPRDVLPGLSSDEKLGFLRKTSYRDFIRNQWGLNEAAANVFQGRTTDFFGLGSDLVSAADARLGAYPGFQGLGLPEPKPGEGDNDELYIHHFPDGNASIARLLVRQLIPQVAPGSGMDDIVSARFDYARLDIPGSPVRLRLDSTAVLVRNKPDATVEVGYMQGGRLYRVEAARAIFAGHAAMLPYICPEVAGEQKQALAAGTRAPVAYVNVLVDNWRPWVRLGVHEVIAPMGFYCRLKLDYPVSLGDYRFASGPDEPMVLHLVHIPTLPPGSVSDQRSAWQAARAQLYGLSFADFEETLRQDLSRILGPGGFDADRDIRAITVNRWGHGYSYMANSLFDEERTPEPYVVARQPVGRIHIAGADAAWDSYVNAAIDQAYRAVAEIP